MMSKTRLLRCISVVMSVLMLFAVVPFTVSAASTDGYTDVKGNGNNAIRRGGNFRLTADTLFTEGGINKDTVIDLNGHTLLLGDDDNGWYSISLLASLTLEGTGTVKISDEDYVITVANTGTLNIASSGVKFEGAAKSDIFLATGGKINCDVELENSCTVEFNGAAGEKVVECGSAEVALANQGKFIVNGEELVANGTQLGIEGEGIVTQYVSLVLDGTIGLKFYFHFPDDAKPSILYYQLGSDKGSLEVGSYEAFIIDIPADRMDDKVYVWFDAAEKPATVNAEYSVKDYINNIKTNKSAESKMYKLAEALGVYGDYAVKYRDGDNEFSIPSTYTEAIDEIYCDMDCGGEPYAPVMGGEYYNTLDAIKFTGMSLVLGSKTVMRLNLEVGKNSAQDPFSTYEITKDHRIRVYSSVTDADGSIYTVFDEQKFTNSGTGTGFGYVGDLKVDVEIPASKLGDTWRVEVGYTDANGKWQCDASISVSPMWYIGNCIDGDFELSSINSLNQMAKALFAYYYYANQFFAN